jgi:steroid 5-alpha reductase family enzyme
MGFVQIYGTAGLVILGLMTFVWLLSLVLKNTSIVDIFWGSGFVLTSWVYFALTPGGNPARKWLAAVLVTIWGMRLTLYILYRNWGKPEDFRYANWREQHGKKWWWYSFFQTFVLQGFLMWVISAPLLAVQIGRGTAGLGWLDFLAVAVWAFGFYFEAGGDLQMARFKGNPANKGKVLDRGVWRYSRHPNYFGDATQWWAYYLLAVASGGFWTVFSPIMMTLLLLRVSGVTLLEKTLKETKPQYREYIETTSSFVPWFPRTKRGQSAGTDS